MYTAKTYRKRSVNTIENSFSAGLDRLLLLNFKPFCQPSDLLIRQLLCFRCRPRPPECTVIQTLIQLEQTISFPNKPFYPIESSSAEEKDRIAVWVKVQFPLDNSGKPVDSQP